jgi:hypothetical protein
MNLEQAVTRPFGITVFGSAVLRVEPDIASLRFAVSHLAEHPKDAFRQAHDGARSVRTFLAQANVSEVGSSRVTLSQTFDYNRSEKRFLGYTAKVAFHVLLRDLDRLEEILAGVVDAGANEINPAELQTSRLKELRAEARRRAVAAAREKAENYCQAAGVTLGPVIHIEDINPEVLSSHGGHVIRETPVDYDQPAHAFDPESIVVVGAVVLAFEIGR